MVYLVWSLFVINTKPGEIRLLNMSSPQVLVKMKREQKLQLKINVAMQLGNQCKQLETYLSHKTFAFIPETKCTHNVFRSEKFSISDTFRRI